MSASETVLAALKSSDKPLKGGEIAEKTGLDKKEVDKALKELKKQDVVHSPKNCYYAAK